MDRANILKFALFARGFEWALREQGFESVDYIANDNNTDAYWETMGQVIAPQGRIVLIVEPAAKLDIGGDFKNKSASISWELMFTRAMFATPDVARQHEILKATAALIDSGKIVCTASNTLTPITAENVIKAHTLIESGKSIGKMVIEGWGD